jgi:hypothetical protein
LVALAAAIASSTVAPPLASPLAPSIWFQNLTVIRYNPLGLLEYARAMFRAPLYESDRAMFATNFAAKASSTSARSTSCSRSPARPPLGATPTSKT